MNILTHFLVNIAYIALREGFLTVFETIYIYYSCHLKMPKEQHCSSEALLNV